MSESESDNSDELSDVNRIASAGPKKGEDITEEDEQEIAQMGGFGDTESTDPEPDPRPDHEVESDPADAPADDSEQSADADEEADEFPPVREWRSRSFRINPEDFPHFRRRWREFRDAYDDEYMTEPDKTATYYNALVLAALSGTPLDDILDEVIDNRVEHVTSQSIDCVSFDD